MSIKSIQQINVNEVFFPVIQVLIAWVEAATFAV